VTQDFKRIIGLDTFPLYPLSHLSFNLDHLVAVVKSEAVTGSDSDLRGAE
jgi:hypothetical protein